MAAYRIEALGSRIVIRTDKEAILICKNLKTARRTIAEAERPATLSLHQIFARRADGPHSTAKDGGGPAGGAEIQRIVSWATPGGG